MEREDRQTIVKMKFGSHLYGTATKSSDMDFKGVLLPSREDVLLASVHRIAKSVSSSTGDDEGKNTPKDVDDDMYLLPYFLHLACEGQTVALDMLHAPLEFLTKRNDLWDEIRLHRSRFYTKNLKAFVGYARKQAAKYGIKGSRLAAAEAACDVLFKYIHEKKQPELRLGEMWNEIPLGEYVEFQGEGDEKILIVCGKKFGPNTQISLVHRPIFMVVSRYGKRAEEAKNNEGIDWKAISHALRAAYQVEEILSKQTITFPRPEAGFLKKVKLGELDFLTEVQPTLEGMIDKVGRMSEESDLPEKVDHEFWDEWLMDVLEVELFDMEWESIRKGIKDD